MPGFTPGISIRCHGDLFIVTAGTSSGRDETGRPSNFPDSKRQQLFVLAAVFERIAGLAQKIWNIDP